VKVTAHPITGRRAHGAVQALRRRDPLLRAWIDRAGPLRIKGRRDPFLSLAEAIVYQQLSGKAAATIWKRFEMLFPARRVRPEGVVALTESRMRSCGLSRQKTAYLRDLSAHFHDGRLEARALRRLSDDEAIETLTQVKGIGRWTAEMFLIFCLKRPDVWPVDDLGVLKGLQRLFKLRRPPERDKALALGERWRPHRSVATWYLWRGLDAGGVG
jgi:DNA-3-methyladenine glycosylase II